jgi:hypothetical protein
MLTISLICTNFLALCSLPLPMFFLYNVSTWFNVQLIEYLIFWFISLSGTNSPAHYILPGAMYNSCNIGTWPGAMFFFIMSAKSNDMENLYLTS